MFFFYDMNALIMMRVRTAMSNPVKALRGE